MKSTSAEGPNKHQLKTAATLRSLLDAAERVFVRDGYERAQMETIAAEAQRTKGAVYAHFRSKEDIFFALLERKGKARRDAFLGSAEGMDLKQRRAIVKKMFLATLADESWPILMLEFKLFALRNKASLQRIRDLYQLVYDDMGKVLLSERPATARSRESEMLALAVLRGMPSAIILEKQFHPAFQSPDSTRQVFDAIFDALLEIGSDPSTPAST